MKAGKERGLYIHPELFGAPAAQSIVASRHAIAAEVRHQLLHHVLHLANAVIHVDPLDASGEEHHRVMEHVHGDLPAHAHL